MLSRQAASPLEFRATSSLNSFPKTSRARCLPSRRLSKSWDATRGQDVARQQQAHAFCAHAESRCRGVILQENFGACQQPAALVRAVRERAPMSCGFTQMTLTAWGLPGGCRTLITRLLRQFSENMCFELLIPLDFRDYFACGILLSAVFAGTSIALPTARSLSSLGRLFPQVGPAHRCDGRTPTSWHPD